MGLLLITTSESNPHGAAEGILVEKTPLRMHTIQLGFADLGKGSKEQDFAALVFFVLSRREGKTRVTFELAKLQGTSILGSVSQEC